MGTIERKARQKEELRELILQAAKKLFLDKGLENTTIRNIADEVEYSVGTVYTHFKDKNEIWHELHQRGFQQLGGDMRILFDISDPHLRLYALGKTYMAFALHNPEMYDLMFNMKAPMEYLKEACDTDWTEGRATFDALRQTVRGCMEAGYFKGHELEPLSFAIWSSVHGMCSLLIRERIRGATNQEPEALLRAAYESVMLLLR